MAGSARTRGLVLALIVLCVTSPALRAQTKSAPALTLDQAEATGLANQPRMLAAQQRVLVAAERVHAARSDDFPTVGFNATGVRVVDPGTAIAAGNITTSSVSDRFAYGGNLTQLVTDFGRTSALIGQARDQAEAQHDLAILTRAQVQLNVRQTYYRVLGAEAVLHAAQAAEANRKLIARQLSELAKSELRSTLDVQFADVLVNQADLAVVRAESLVSQARAHLATAMGLDQPVAAALVEQTPASAPLPPSLDDLLQQARAERADLRASQANESAARHLEDADRRLSLPKLNVLAAAGQIPYHDSTLHDDYAAAGFNLSIPVFNGGLFKAEQREAAHEAMASSADTRQLQLQVNEQVRDAWISANEAYQSIAVTARLVAASKEALRLAQDRYQAGLGSIVELNEAQLNETSAEIDAAQAIHLYLSRRADLDFATGELN